MPHSTIRDEVFRAAAKRIYGSKDLTVHDWGTVQRTHDGGAYVEVLVWVSADEAARELAGGDRRVKDMAVDPSEDRRGKL